MLYSEKARVWTSYPSIIIFSSSLKQSDVHVSVQSFTCLCHDKYLFSINILLGNCFLLNIAYVVKRKAA